MNSSKNSNKTLPNYYLTLDILPGSSQNEIHHAYKRAKMTYSSGSLAAYSILEEENNSKVLEEIETAYTVLSHPSHRREYDIKMGFSTWIDETNQDSKGHYKELNRPTILSNSKEDEGLKNPFEEINYDTSNSSPTKLHSKETKKSPIHVVVPVKDAMHFEANPDFEERIRNCEILDGAFLRAVRIYKKVTVEQLANRCKLAPSRIQAIEEENLANLYVQAVYLRGHVAIICGELGIPNSESLAKGYLDRMRSESKLPKQTL